MAKSIKLKDNTYIDSTGVTHNRELLSTLLNNINTNINKLTPVTLFDGTCKFGNDICTVSSDYKYVDVYIKYKYDSTHLGRTIIRVDTSYTPSTNECCGITTPIQDSYFVEIETEWKTNRVIRAGWIGTYPNFASSTATAHQNDSNYVVYKVIGYKY